MAEKHKVIIRKCEDYDDVERIRGIVREGMEELGARPHGKLLLKPNLIFAHRRYGRYGFTNPSVIEAIIDVMGAVPEVEKITIGERTGVTVPTRYVFHEAGYERFRKKPKVEVCFFDEAPLVEVPLKKGTVHKFLKFARPLVEADYKVWAPKLKHHVSSLLTCALKLNIGICDSAQRLPGHDWRLEEKIADLYEVGYPDLVVVDGVVAGQQNEVVPTPLDVGVIMMGTSGVAIDSVGARIIGFESDEIKHLKIARERGYEPVSDDDIEIVSEVPMSELKERTKNFDRAYEDPREVDTPVRFFLGTYPDGDDICNGGCVNMIKGALAIMEAYSPGSLVKARPCAVVIGKYDGDVDSEGHPVIMVGKCTEVSGEVKGKVKRVGGCPVLIPNFMTPACFYFKTPNPYFDPIALSLFPYYTVRQMIGKFINRVL
jgi:uncharacterized protein (DUF362 family)